MDLGGVLVVDEFDRLHPDLAAEAVRLFHDPRVNAKRAQLLFASHDPTVMGMTQGVPLLERDQVCDTHPVEDFGAPCVGDCDRVYDRLLKHVRGYRKGMVDLSLLVARLAIARDRALMLAKRNDCDGAWHPQWYGPRYGDG